MKTTYYVIKILYVVEIIGVILVPWMIICDLFSIDSFPVWILIPSFIASIYKESLKKKNGELSIFKHNVEGYYGLYILVMTIVLLITGGFWIDMVK